MEKAKDLRYTYTNKLEEQIAIISRMLMTTSSTELDKESNIIMSKKDTDKLVNRAKELSSESKYITLFEEEEKNYKELIRNTEIDWARKEGSKETVIENAKNAINIGLDSEIISKITGLSIREIENLK